MDPALGGCPSLLESYLNHFHGLEEIHIVSYVGWYLELLTH